MVALTARGVSVQNQAKFPVDRGNQQVVACADGDAECAAVVAWVQARMAANPAGRLGIVAPDLAGVRDRLEFLLDDALHPALIRPDAAEAPRAFFSLGRALADLPLIRVALDLLALGSGRAKVEQSRLSGLLLTGGWSAAEAEADGRGRLDAALRRDLPYFTTLPALIKLAGRLAENEAPLCPQTVAALDACRCHRAANRKLPPGQ
jgi:exodeoxyribonuclease-5